MFHFRGVRKPEIFAEHTHFERYSEGTITLGIRKRKTRLRKSLEEEKH